MASQLLDKANIQWEAFLVSDIKNCQNINKDIIIEFNPKILDSPEVGIIMGLNYKNYKQVVHQFNIEQYESKLLTMY